MNPSRRVVVTGFGSINPLGVSAEESFKRLLCGHSGLNFYRPTQWSFDKKFADILSKWVVGQIPSSWTTISNWNRWPRFMQLLLDSSEHALIHAQLVQRDGDKLALSIDTDLSKIGSCLSTGMGSLEEICDTFSAISDRGPKRVSPYFVPKILFNIPNGLLTEKYGFQGPSHSTVTACATGVSSLIDACFLISNNDADIMVVGASESCINSLAYSGFSQAKALATASSHSKDPASYSRPFDKHRNGFVLSEGAGCLILEELQHALRRKAPIVAEILGFGMSSDAYHITAPCPEGKGAKLAMQRCLASAKLSQFNIGYLNCHATSTPLGDLAESRAIDKVFSEQSSVAVTSNKGSMGHLLGAAGVVESIFSIMSLNQDIIPPTLNCEDPDTEIPRRIQVVSKYADSSKKFNAVMKNSFGFGGTNTSIIFSKFPPIF